MAATTRLDCVLGSAALLRQALVQSVHHARHRHAFGKPLVEQPLMRNVLADLALEGEAAMALALRLARAVDERADARARAWSAWARRAKLWVCKPRGRGGRRHGGLGATATWEEADAQADRETPVNSIWEGSGNVMALDVLRALQREPEALPALERELALARGQDRDFDEALARGEALAADTAQAEFRRGASLAAWRGCGRPPC